jgi:hypothetical protein
MKNHWCVDNKSFRIHGSTPMNLLRRRPLQVVAALVAFFAFSLDVLDEISDRAQRAQCNQTAQSGAHHKQSCPNCCHNHSEAAVITKVSVSFYPETRDEFAIEFGHEAAPSSLPTAIDHPPQLA